MRGHGQLDVYAQNSMTMGGGRRSRGASDRDEKEDTLIIAPRPADQHE
jgi:hypothetical protein